MPYIRKLYDTGQLRDYSLLFTRSEISRLVESGRSKLVSHCVRQYDSKVFTSDKTYGAYYKYLYKVLLKHYANEYIYKNEFINRFLYPGYVGRQCYTYSELNLGGVIADLASFNGHAIGYEIKTELDSPERLCRQMEHYRKVFNEVYLVIPEDKCDLYTTAVDPRVGIITYNSTHRAFGVLRSSEQRPGPDADKLMEILLTKEYQAIVRAYYGAEALKESTDFTLFEDCRHLMHNIPPEMLNEFFITALKNRRQIAPRFSRKYTELNQALIANRMDPDFMPKLQTRLEQHIYL